jgi:hypothetical protein
VFKVLPRARPKWRGTLSCRYKSRLPQCWPVVHWHGPEALVPFAGAVKAYTPVVATSAQGPHKTGGRGMNGAELEDDDARMVSCTPVTSDG